MMKKIPNNLLRHAREERGWSQLRLAEELGVEEQTVRSWERGTRFPSPRFRDRLCELFGMSPEQLGLQRSLVSSQPIDSLQNVSSSADVFSPRRHQIDRNRTSMLRSVRSIWIEGVLNHSLHHAALIELGLQEHPDALENPWRLIVQETNLPPHPLPPETSIAQVYDTANGKLLILGKPGAGKTTLLLELARDLLNRAGQDETVAIPVIFSLAEWSAKQLPLAVWLIEELADKYHVPHSIAQEWIQNDRLIVLLDGLDEVAKESRSSCVKAINSYQYEHVSISLVVCCREEEYFTQATRVGLQRAVQIQPLSPAQIENYLIQAGEQLASVRQALQEDQELQEMAKTPLLLSIITLAYQDASHDIVLSGGPEERRQQILDLYIERMLTRRSVNQRYSTRHTIHWLACLAKQMQKQGQSALYVERMQIDLLDNSRPYIYTTFRSVTGFKTIIIAALFGWLRGGQRGTIAGVGVGLLGMLGGAPGNRILQWMAPGLGNGVEGGGSLGILMSLVSILVVLVVSGFPLPSPSTKALRSGLQSGLRNGLLIGGINGIIDGILFSLYYGIPQGILRGIGATVFSTLIVGLTAGLISGLSYRPVPPQRLEKAFNKRDRFLNVIIFTTCGLSNGVVYALLIGAVTTNVLTYGIVIGLFHGLFLGLGSTDPILSHGFEIHPAEAVSWSWQNIARDMGKNSKRGAAVGAFILVPTTLIIACASGLSYGPAYGLRYGAVFGGVVGLVGGIGCLLTSILASGWTSTMIPENQLLRPNEGMHRSLKNAIFAAFLFGPIGGIASGIVSGLAFGLIGGLADWPILALGFTIIFSIIFFLEFLLVHGSVAWIEHFVLRWYLWREGKIPLNYIAFLNYAVERILLQRVGRGYIFPHRILLEHFAAKTTNK